LVSCFAPCSYCFRSAGSDGNTWVWTTDWPSPVRLFAGHASSSGKTWEWHPNCNYILTRRPYGAIVGYSNGSLC
jgi:WD40 repeat protein